eukprot:Rmarinus@m.12871
MDDFDGELTDNGVPSDAIETLLHNRPDFRNHVGKTRVGEKYMAAGEAASPPPKHEPTVGGTSAILHKTKTRVESWEGPTTKTFREWRQRNPRHKLTQEAKIQRDHVNEVLRERVSHVSASLDNKEPKACIQYRNWRERNRRLIFGVSNGGKLKDGKSKKKLNYPSWESKLPPVSPDSFINGHFVGDLVSSDGDGRFETDDSADDPLCSVDGTALTEGWGRDLDYNSHHSFRQYSRSPISDTKHAIKKRRGRSTAPHLKANQSSMSPLPSRGGIHTAPHQDHGKAVSLPHMHER